MESNTKIQKHAINLSESKNLFESQQWLVCLLVERMTDKYR